MDTTQIPDKLNFKIGEVSRIADVKAHVLRYWESEFAALRPQKTSSNQRIYARRDVEIVLLIKELLYEEGFTIAGAQKRLRGLLRARRRGETESGASREILHRLRQDVEAILAILDEDV